MKLQGSFRIFGLLTNRVPLNRVPLNLYCVTSTHVGFRRFKLISLALLIKNDLKREMLAASLLPMEINNLE